MKKRIIFILTLFVALTLLFAIQKPLFMWYNSSLASGSTVGDWLAVMWHGLSLDMTIAGYLMLLPTLMVLATIWIRGRFWRAAFKCYFALMAIVTAIVFVADMALYPYWGYKLNSSVWFYLSSPKDAVASLEFWPTVAQIFMIVAYAVLFYIVTVRLVLPLLLGHSRNDRHVGKDTYTQEVVACIPGDNGRETVLAKVLSSLCTLVLLGLLILPIRGGTHASVANEGRVYFSSDMFLNHSAVNPCFTLLDSSTRRQSFAEQYHYMDDDKATATVAEMTAGHLPASSSADRAPEIVAGQQSMGETAGTTIKSLLKTKRPNIVLVILESFAGTTVGAVGGDVSITPNLNAVAAEGVTFNRIYANSFRTDRALVSILAAYPAQPTSSIMKYPAKSQTLPGMAGALRDAGYATSIYYGGDIDFTNMRSFFYGSGFDEVVGQDALSFSEPMAQWGYDDRLMCDYFAERIIEKSAQEQPFFTTLLTLSSHEPFDVPFQKFDNLYANSVAFTDDCIGQMMERLRQSPAWDNTLVIFTPDHSFLYPENVARYSPEQHHVFFIWGGGAVAQSSVIPRVGTQTDLAATLLGQLSLPADNFAYSKDLLDSAAPEFAFYTFNNGFGMVDKEGNSVVWDCTSQKVSMEQGSQTDRLVEQGQAYLQLLMEDFDSRGSNRIAVAN